MKLNWNTHETPLKQNPLNYSWNSLNNYYETLFKHPWNTLHSNALGTPLRHFETPLYDPWLFLKSLYCYYIQGFGYNISHVRILKSFWVPKVIKAPYRPYGGFKIHVGIVRYFEMLYNIEWYYTQLFNIVRNWY